MLSHSASAYTLSFVYYISASIANWYKECQPSNNSHTVLHLHTFSFQLWYLYIIDWLLGTSVLRYVRCVDVRWARTPPTVRLERVSVTKLVMRHLVTTLTGKPSGAELLCVCYLLSLPGFFTVCHAKNHSTIKTLVRPFALPLAQTKNHSRAVLATLENYFG